MYQFDFQRAFYVGAMPEDLVLVTETGTENLTAHMPNDLYTVR